MIVLASSTAVLFVTLLILAFLFFGEGTDQRNTEGTAPFLDTRFPEKVVRKSDGLKYSEQTFVLLEI